MFSSFVKNGVLNIPLSLYDRLNLTVEDSAFVNGNNLTKLFPLYTQKINGLSISRASESSWNINVGVGQIVENSSLFSIGTPVVRNLKIISTTNQEIPSLLDGVTKTVYVYYYWNGSASVIGYQKSAPTADELADKLFLGAILSNNGLTIDDVRSIHLPNEPETKTLLTLGAINVNKVFPNPIPNSLQLSIADQLVKFAGRWYHSSPKTPHSKTLLAANPINYYLCQPNGNLIQSFPENIFNFNRIWNNNSVANLSDPNNFSVQFLYRYPNESFLLLLGVHEYTTLALASTMWDKIENYRPNLLKDNALFVCAIAGKGNATNITNNNPINGEVLIFPSYQ